MGVITLSPWMHLTWPEFLPFPLCRQLKEKGGTISVQCLQPVSVKARNNFLLR